MAKLLECLQPHTGYRVRGVNPLTGKRFGLLGGEELKKYAPFQLESVAFRCGKCLNCLKYRGSVWMARCIAESRMHEDNAFVTLTVDDANIDEVFPFGGSLDHLPFQLFMKRLRKQTGVKGLKYMMCGEYGELSHRPHYHAIIFGLAPYVYEDTHVKRPDGLGFYKNRVDNPVFQKCWPYGEVFCGSVTSGSIAYVSGYTLKQFVLGRDADWYKSRGLAPEYVKCSRRPGLGRSYFEKFCLIDFHDNGSVDCGVPVENSRLFPGRYFLDWLRLTASSEYDKLLLSYERGNSSDCESEIVEYDKALDKRNRRVDYLVFTSRRNKRM